MKSRMQRIALSALIASVVFGSKVYAASAAVWDINNAVVGGGDCLKSDVAIVAAGDDISLVFSKAGIHFAKASRAGSALYGCLVRIPVTVDAGVALSKLSQTLQWGYSKGLGSQAEVVARATFLGAPTSAIHEYLGSLTSGTVALTTSTVEDTFAVGAPYCTGTPVAGLFGVNLSAAALRSSPSQSISIGLEGETLKFEAQATWTACP